MNDKSGSMISPHVQVGETCGPGPEWQSVNKCRRLTLPALLLCSWSVLKVQGRSLCFVKTQVGQPCGWRSTAGYLVND